MPFRLTSSQLIPPSWQQHPEHNHLSPPGQCPGRSATIPNHSMQKEWKGKIKDSEYPQCSVPACSDFLCQRRQRFDRGRSCAWEYWEVRPCCCVTQQSGLWAGSGLGAIPNGDTQSRAPYIGGCEGAHHTLSSDRCIFAGSRRRLSPRLAARIVKPESFQLHACLLLLLRIHMPRQAW